MVKKESIIIKHALDIQERKDIENAMAGDEKTKAVLEYIAACDYPEVFEEEETDEENL